MRLFEQESRFILGPLEIGRRDVREITEAPDLVLTIPVHREVSGTWFIPFKLRRHPIRVSILGLEPLIIRVSHYRIDECLSKNRRMIIYTGDSFKKDPDIRRVLRLVKN